jgi:hypothetical protein
MTPAGGRGQRISGTGGSHQSLEEAGVLALGAWINSASASAFSPVQYGHAAAFADGQDGQDGQASSDALSLQHGVCCWWQQGVGCSTSLFHEVGSMPTPPTV